MLYQVSSIQFNCNTDFYNPQLTQQVLSDRYQSTVWEVDTDEDIVDLITDSVGYTVTEIKYHPYTI